MRGNRPCGSEGGADELNRPSLLHCSESLVRYVAKLEQIAENSSSAPAGTLPIQTSRFLKRTCKATWRCLTVKTAHDTALLTPFPTIHSRHYVSIALIRSHEDRTGAYARVSSIRSQQVQESAVELMAVELGVGDVLAPRIDDAERAAQIPQRPAEAGFPP